MAEPWWRGLPPAQTMVECGGHQHVVRWAGGSLELTAHPDAEAELVLAALGGERAACTDLAEVWARYADDLAVLALGPRWAADELDVSPDDVAGIRSGGTFAVVRTGPMRPFTHGPSPGAQPHRPGPRRVPLRRGTTPALGQRLDLVLPGLLDLLTLMTLGPAFQLRLAGTVAAAWSEAGQARARADRRPELAAALTGRLGPAVESWLGDDVGPVVATLHEGEGWGSLELTSGDGDVGLRASLPLDWLARVWACGLAMVDGHLVVGVESARWPHAEVLALPEPGATPVTLSVHASPEPDAHWVVDENGDEAGAGDEPAPGEEAGAT